MRRVALLLLAFSSLCTACAGERPSVDEGAAREVGSDPADEAIALASADTPSVRLAVAGQWSGDPADAGPASLGSRVLADLLFEGLTRLDDDRQPVAGLAERWFVSDDRLVWTFVLPADLTDGDGRRLVARDLKQSLERVAARGPADQAATALTAVTGWRDHMDGTTGGVAGISAPDETTLVIRLDSPFELLLEVLASPAYGITGVAADGTLRTTGSFRRSDDPAVFPAVDDATPVASIEVVSHPDGPLAAMVAGDADWAVLGPDDDPVGLSADVLRQPLDLEVAVVARMPDPDDRRGLLGALSPLLLANTIDGVTARVVSAGADAGVPPSAALLDVPAGVLEPIGAAIARQLETAGVAVRSVTSEPTDFAARIADGEAQFFPVVIAGGVGPAGGVLRLATPGAIDDFFGPASETRSQLAVAVVEEFDVEQRDLFVTALERALIEDGYLLPIGRFEVRVAIGTRLDGLVPRDDGTLDVSAVTLAG